jgi:hypothetical protein
MQNGKPPISPNISKRQMNDNFKKYNLKTSAHMTPRKIHKIDDEK